MTGPISPTASPPSAAVQERLSTRARARRSVVERTARNSSCTVILPQIARMGGLVVTIRRRRRRAEGAPLDGRKEVARRLAVLASGPTPAPATESERGEDRG